MMDEQAVFDVSTRYQLSLRRLFAAVAGSPKARASSLEVGCRFAEADQLARAYHNIVATRPEQACFGWRLVDEDRPPPGEVVWVRPSLTDPEITPKLAVLRKGTAGGWYWWRAGGMQQRRTLGPDREFRFWCPVTPP